MNDRALAQIDGTRTDFADGFRIVTDVENRRAGGNDILDFVLAFSLEARVTDGERLVYYQHVRLNIDVNREAETHFHTAGIRSDRLVDIVAQLGKLDNSFLNLLDVGVLQTENIAFQVNVLTSGHLGREAGGQLQERGDLAVDDDFAFIRKGNAGNHFKQRGLSGAVIADDTDGFTAVNFKRNVVERLVGLGIARLEEQRLEACLVVFVENIGFAYVLESNNCFCHTVPPLKHVRELFPETVVVEDTEGEHHDKLREENEKLRLVEPERSVIEEAVAVAVGEEVNRVEEHDKLQRFLEAVGIVHDAGQPEDTGHNRHNQALEVLAERGHRRGRPRQRQEKHKHHRAVEEELQIIPARTDSEENVDVHNQHEHEVYIQSGETGVGENGGNRKLDLGDKLPVGAQGFGALNDAVLNKEPRNDTDEHKGEEVNRERLMTAEIDMHGSHGLDADREGEPVNKDGERRFDDCPAGADNSAFICFNQLVFGEQKDLFSKSLVFFENRSNRISQKTTSVSYHQK